jgi:septum site-determining protein MinC
MTSQQSHEPAAGGAAIRLRGASFTLLLARVEDLQRPDGLTSLKRRIAQAPSFFEQAPVVFDLTDLPAGQPVDFPGLSEALRRLGLEPLGVQYGDAGQQAAARAAGLAVIGGSLPGLARSVPVDKALDSQRRPAPTTVVERPIRAGAQVYAARGDLIVMTNVAAGAEVLADGHLHIYGRLRGRALAGAKGNAAARIFCRSLEAELISIAGRWLVRDEIDEALIGQPAQIRLDGDTLKVLPLD